MASIAVVGGDGIGPEVTAIAVEVIGCLGLDLEFDHLEKVSADRFLADGTTLTDDEFQRLGSADTILFGAVGDPRVTTPDYARGVLLRLRSELALYANVRPALLLADRLSPLRDPASRHVDLILVRENNEGLYAGIGGALRAGSPDEFAVDEEVNSYGGVSRIIDHAFSISRRSVCMVDKSNAVRFGGQLWQRCWKEAAGRYPEVARSHLYVDAAAMKLVTDPSSFDVIVTNNSYGDILSDLAAVIAGGIGLAASANINPQTRRGLFEPVHGSAPDLAGRALANPVGSILSAAMLLDFLGHPDAAQAVRGAVQRAVAAGHCTPDAGGSLSTPEAGRAVLSELRTRQ
jgi:3-isopropylmalate dehydrogenase